MEYSIARCCGLDVHQATVVACVQTVEHDRGKPKRMVRTFATTRWGLEDLRSWLKECEVTHVCMEGTGVYWRPLYEVLEGHFDLTVANARHVKAVPGRKTDVNDAQWLAQLLSCGLLRKSFVPSREIRVVRDVARYRRALVHEETAKKNRILKLLETMGIKVATFATDVFGVSGMAFMKAIVEGVMTPQQIADLARGRMRKKRQELALALDVIVQPHHRMLLRDQVDDLITLQRRIASYDDQLVEMTKPWRDTLEVLSTIDGIGAKAAIEIFAEVGPDLASFPTEHAFAAWAGVAPGLNQSGGKHGRARRRRGNPYLQSALFEAALSATNKRDSFLRAKYRRMRARTHMLVARFAVARKLAHAIYRAIKNGIRWIDRGEAYAGPNRSRQLQRLASALTKLNCTPEELARLIEHARPPEHPPPAAHAA